MDLDVIWIVACAGLVFLMQPGFMCLESGLTRSKNSINVAVKNLADLGISICFFWGFGFALMFGPSLSGWIGTSGFFLSVETDPKLAAFFIFQMMFCGTATTIVSGALAERLKFKGYLAISVLISGLVYPLFGHWAWNGVNSGGPVGWLGQLGFVDFAGSTVVHSIGGWVSLAALLVIGPRTGRYVDIEPLNQQEGSEVGEELVHRRSGRTLRKIHGSNLPFSVLGAMLLWIGWLGFNGGSTLELNNQIPAIIVHTVLSGAAGMLAAALLGWCQSQMVEAETLINGSLAGLISICAACHAVSSPMAVLIGALGGIVTLLATRQIALAGIDDGVNAVALHGCAGAWGTLAAGLFGDLTLLGTDLTRHQLVLIQLLGLGIACVWGFGLTYIILKNLNRILPLRVSVEEEEIGLNVSEHQAKTEVYDLLQTMDRQAATQDFSLRVKEEPFTEVGKIARRYNRVMASLENYASQLEYLNANLEQTVAERTSELTEANEELKRLDKLKDEFLANTSHELRTPINSIIGLSEFLLEWKLGPLPEKVSENLAMISNSGRRLYRLVSDLLDFSKILHDDLTLQLKSVGLREVAEIVKDLCTPLIGHKKLSIVNSTSKALPLIWVDENRLHQILYNLVGNAIKFTEQGIIEIAAFLEPVGHAGNTLDSPRFLTVMVSDTGIGIPEDKFDTIFESFTQAEGSTAREYGGIGLGLAITKMLVELQGGMIWVESQLGCGSQFHFTIPLSEQKEPEFEVTPTTPNLFEPPLEARTLSTQLKTVEQSSVVESQLAPIAPGPQTQILTVDDDPTNLQVLKNFLEMWGYQVAQAFSGHEALSLLAEGYEPSLILLDVMMPRMTGYEVTEAVRTRWQRDELPIILLTAKNQLEDEVIGLQAGANDYLTKPIVKEGLLARIKTHLALRQESLERRQSDADRIQLEAANKAKTEFLANMSHELRTPLNSVIGFAQLLGRDRSIGPEQQQKLQIINRSGEHLLSLINNILDISKIEAGKIALNDTDFDLDRVLAEVLSLFDLRATRKGITLRLERDSQVPQYIQADEGKLRQIILNLLSNSVKFTTTGQVVLRVKLQNQMAHRSGDTALDPLSKILRIEVEDTGPGISAVELPLLFIPFEQTAVGRSANQGTGLGLSICKQFVELMGGEISVTSQVEKGSCFFFVIPIQKCSTPLLESSVKRVIGIAPDQPSYRILVVDDVSENCQLLAELLLSVGFAVKQANNGQDAVQIWQDWQPHLIWMDLRMPEMDGVEAARLIREGGPQQDFDGIQEPRYPIIIALTATAAREKKEAILASGFDAYAVKPFNEADIWQLIMTHLGVKFLYEELPPTVSGVNPQDISESGPLIEERLMGMPADWLSEMWEACSDLKGKRVRKLILEIPSGQAELARHLRELADHYQFEQILELLDETVSSD